MKKLGIIFTLCLFLTSVIAGVAAVGIARADDGGRTYPIMRPDRETLEKWIEAYNNAPRAYIEMEGFGVPSPAGSLDLLDHLEYTPIERNQGYCNNCWAWAGTGCLEIALDVQKGIKDRLSVQYMNSCQENVIGITCCRGGWLFQLADFYDATQMAIPWANTNATWQSGDGSCGASCNTISTDPNYPIASIQETTIPTQTVTQGTAIANIKNVLNQDKAVWFGFFLPDGDAFWNFTSFWGSGTESDVYDMDQFCGTSYDFITGVGHAVLCVGYNDTDPGNKYWVMLNSWGTASGNRPNGLFRIDMDMDYDGVYPGYGGGYAFYWQTLDVTFGMPPLPDIAVFPDNFDITLPPNTTQDCTLTITNNGDADLSYDIGHWETTGMTAPPGAWPPDLSSGEEEGPPELIGLEHSEPISFAPPPPLTGTAEEIAYDDGVANGAWCFNYTGGAFAVRFTPSSYPVNIQTARICLADPAWYSPPWPDSDHELFAVGIFDDDGAGGSPGTLLGYVNTTATNWGWWDVDLSGLEVTVTEGDFYIACKQLGDYPDCEGICADYGDHDGRSWLFWVSTLTWYRVENTIGALDWMIRCVVEEADCPWLGESPTSGTVGPGASHNITVTINTTGLGSNYTAEIVIASNDPDENPAVVPVSLRVGLMEGDTTLDLHVSIVDALAIAQHLVDFITLTADQLKCADTTDEDPVTVTIVDALHIAQWLVDPTGSLGVLAKPLWESPADDDMLPPVR